ncbi:MAG: MFS transporter [Dehalococcoidia bacterium]|nr:MAG: MFS transporter [Dehalococcoidia bacterium]
MPEDRLQTVSASPPLAPAKTARFHPGWFVVLAAGLVFFFQSGMAGYLLGVFQPAWLAEFGWPQTWLSSAFALGSLLPGLTGVLVGRWTDRYGPRLIIVCGALLAGLGYILLAGVQSFAVFCVAYGIGAIGRCGMSQVPASAAIARWFVGRRALAMGLASTGISLAGIILVPLATWLILSFGWRTAVVVVGIAVWAVVLPVVWFAMAGTPSERGVQPYGSAAASPPPASGDATLGIALRDTTFWLLAIGQMLGHAGSLSIGIHAQNAIIDKGAGAAEAATAISLMALCALLSRFLYSWLGDLLPAAPLLAWCFFLQGVGYALLALTAPGPGVWAFAIVYGLSLGGSVALQAVVIIERYGVRGYGAILGALGLPMTFASAISPVVAAAGYDATGSYTGPFLGFGVLAVCGAICYLAAYLSGHRRPPGRSR